jgi:hypothetical protein
MTTKAKSRRKGPPIGQAYVGPVSATKAKAAEKRAEREAWSRRMDAQGNETWRAATRAEAQKFARAMLSEHAAGKMPLTPSEFAKLTCVAETPRDGDCTNIVGMFHARLEAQDADKAARKTERTAKLAQEKATAAWAAAGWRRNSQGRWTQLHLDNDPIEDKK